VVFIIIGGCLGMLVIKWEGNKDIMNMKKDKIKGVIENVRYTRL
jgi:hypothetical protein